MYWLNYEFIDIISKHRNILTMFPQSEIILEIVILVHYCLIITTNLKMQRKICFSSRQARKLGKWGEPKSVSTFDKIIVNDMKRDTKNQSV